MGRQAIRHMLRLAKGGNGTVVNCLFCEFHCSCGGTELSLCMCDCIHYRLELLFPVVAVHCLGPRKYLDRASGEVQNEPVFM